MPPKSSSRVDSTLKAKMRFPEIFKVSPVQSAERSTSEEAAQSEVDAFENAAERASFRADEIASVRSGKANDLGLEISKSITKTSPSATIAVPSLYSVYLPFLNQHRIIVEVQAMLENSCYAFAERNLMDRLEQEGWDWPERVELYIWVGKLFRETEDLFDEDKIEELGKPLVQILDSMAQLRHTAVHRLHVTAQRVEQFLIEAESLANLLGDEPCYQRLSRFRREATLAIDELSRSKDLLELRHKANLESIAAQRAELDRLERVATEELLRDDTEYQAIAGSNLEMALGEPSTVLHSSITSEQDTSSEADADSDDFGEPIYSSSIVARPPFG